MRITYLLHDVTWPRQTTYDDICDTYFRYVIKHCQSTATVVFDGYHGPPSTKSVEQNRRSSRTSTADIMLTAPLISCSLAVCILRPLLEMEPTDLVLLLRYHPFLIKQVLRLSRLQLMLTYFCLQPWNWQVVKRLLCWSEPFGHVSCQDTTWCKAVSASSRYEHQTSKGVQHKCDTSGSRGLKAELAFPSRHNWLWHTVCAVWARQENDISATYVQLWHTWLRSEGVQQWNLRVLLNCLLLVKSLFLLCMEDIFERTTMVGKRSSTNWVGIEVPQ